VCGNSLGSRSAELKPEIATPVVGRISIQPLPINTRCRYADSIPVDGSRREIADYDDRWVILITATHESDAGTLAISDFKPLERARINITAVQRRRLAKQPVQILD
jgi:hypothetical protein